MCERLLVVDDDEHVRRTYQAHFSGAGFEVHSASSLQEAAERLAGSPNAKIVIVGNPRGGLPVIFQGDGK